MILNTASRTMEGAEVREDTVRSPPPHGQSLPTSQEQLLVEDLELADTRDGRAAGPESPEDVSSEDRSLRETAEAAEDTIRKEVTEVTDAESPAPARLPEVTSVEESVPSAAAAVSRAGRARDSTAPTEKAKTSVRILVQQLVSRTLKKSKVPCAFGDPADVAERLAERTWAEVEGLDFDITPKIFKNLHKAVFKDLSKKWGCAEKVLVSMILGEPAVEKFIAASFKHHLMTPWEQDSAIWRFLCCFCRVSGKPFTDPW